MVIVDTSVWVDVLRDGTGSEALALKEVVGDQEIALTRFTRLELLQGARAGIESAVRVPRKAGLSRAAAHHLG